MDIAVFVITLFFKIQNAILQRHAEEVSGATSKLRAETAAAAERTAALLNHRRTLVAALVQALQALAIPGIFTSPVLDNLCEQVYLLAQCLITYVNIYLDALIMYSILCRWAHWCYRTEH